MKSRGISSPPASNQITQINDTDSKASKHLTASEQSESSLSQSSYTEKSPFIHLFFYIFLSFSSSRINLLFPINPIIFGSRGDPFQYLCNLTGCGPRFPDPVREKTGGRQYAELKLSLCKTVRTKFGSHMKVN